LPARSLEGRVPRNAGRRQAQGEPVISLSDVYDKDLNFLIGSGASYGLLPTLKLGIKNENDKAWSLEELATHFEDTSDARYIPLFMHYYQSCIRPAQEFVPELMIDETAKAVLANYQQFIELLLSLLPRRKVLERRCNLFTTNFDGCIPLTADRILERGSHDFVLNDGTRGFRRKVLEARNFSTFLCQTGIFDRHQTSVPQVNFIQLHGSVYWRKTTGGIEVNYGIPPGDGLLSGPLLAKLQPFSQALMNSDSGLEALANPFTDDERQAFWTKYKELPVVNPTKWKFHETVYEEHYYQMLRLLSYELEKPNAVLITFGFSFADEHILNLVKRSLSNPHLQVFVCCHSKDAHTELSEVFRRDRNVRCLALPNEEPLDFTAFNNQILAFQTDASVTPQSAAPPKSTGASPAEGAVGEVA
jgi:hypothetical protein